MAQGDGLITVAKLIGNTVILLAGIVVAPAIILAILILFVGAFAVVILRKLRLIPPRDDPGARELSVGSTR